MEKSYDIASKIKGAMIYATFILVVLTGVGIALISLALIGLTMTARYYFRISFGRHHLDVFKLRIPIFGRWINY